MQNYYEATAYLNFGHLNSSDWKALKSWRFTTGERRELVECHLDSIEWIAL